MQAEAHACEGDANVTASATATDVSATPSSVQGQVRHLSIHILNMQTCMHTWQCMARIRLAFQPSPSVSACVLPHRRVDACICRQHMSTSACAAHQRIAGAHVCGLRANGCMHLSAAHVCAYCGCTRASALPSSRVWASCKHVRALFLFSA
jgi:hypothetical protein